MTASKFLKNVSATLVAAAVCNAGQTEASLQKDDLGVDSVDDLNKMFYGADKPPEANAAPKEFFAYQAQMLFEEKLSKMLPHDWASEQPAIDSTCKIATEIKEGKLTAMLAFGGRRLALSETFPADFEKKDDVPKADMEKKEKLDDAKVQSTLITLQLHALLRNAFLPEDEMASLEGLKHVMSSLEGLKGMMGGAVPETENIMADVDKMTKGKLKDMAKKMKEQKKSEAVKAAKVVAQGAVDIAKQQLTLAKDADESRKTQLKKAVKDAEEQMKVTVSNASKGFDEQKNDASTLESLLKQLDNGDAAKDPKKFLSTLMHRGFLLEEQNLRAGLEARLAEEEAKKTPDADAVKGLKAKIALCDKRIAYLNSQLGYNGGMAMWLLVLLIVLGVAVIGAALYFFVFANKEDSQQRLPSHEGDLDDSEEEELAK